MLDADSDQGSIPCASIDWLFIAFQRRPIGRVFVLLARYQSSPVFCDEGLTGNAPW